MPNAITEDNYPEFKKAYEKAKNSDEKTFMFEDQQVLVTYAKYIVQFVENTY